MQVELSVEWNEVNCSFKACDWSIYPNIALVTFINDIFEEHSNILANKGVAASVKVYLVKLAQPLGKVTAPLLQQLLTILVLFPIKGDWHAGINYHG
jgi:hypothetical protein